VTKREFMPDWTKQAPPEKSYRSIFKFGGPLDFKHPSPAMLRLFCDRFGMSDTDFQTKRQEGNEPVVLSDKPVLSSDRIDRFVRIVGPENVATDDYNRVKFSRGQSVKEVLALRRNEPHSIADLIVHPRDKDDVRRIVALCHEQRIPLCVYGGGSSVVMGLSPERGGVVLVMGTHMNKVLRINEQNQTATVQPGMMGPAFEEALNEAPVRFKTKRRFTCGHFPQSFEMSSVGGWIVTLGSGQASTYYGDAYHLVLAQEYVTPAGCFSTIDYPATATGPKVNDIMKGSEGAFGVLVELTVKIFRFMPENRRRFSFMFPTWEAAVEAGREIMQGEFGMPAVFRISDPEETDNGLRMYGMDRPLVERVLTLRGLRPMQRCICMGTAEGDRGYTRLVKRRIKKICRRHGAMYLTGYGLRKWEKTRFKEALMREDCMDYGLLIDTLETSVTWDKLFDLHREVRAFVKSRPNTICMTHASHFYPNGTNLYFILVLKPKPGEDYDAFHRGVVETIVRHGGSISHHHGIGKLLAPWMETHLGKEQVDVLRALKRHFDPHHIMNPGGLLALDEPE